MRSAVLATVPGRQSVCVCGEVRGELVVGAGARRGFGVLVDRWREGGQGSLRVWLTLIAQIWMGPDSRAASRRHAARHPSAKEMCEVVPHHQPPWGSLSPHRVAAAAVVVSFNVGKLVLGIEPEGAHSELAWCCDPRHHNGGRARRNGRSTRHTSSAHQSMLTVLELYRLLDRLSREESNDDST